MANQHTVNNYSEYEVNKIISLYENDMSFSKIGLILKRKKNNIKKILIEQGVYVEKRDNIKKEFTKEDVDKIIRLYSIKNLSIIKIGNLFNVGKNPIRRVLIERNLLRKGYSDGKKIYLSEEQKEKIRVLYLDKYKNYKEIGSELNLSAGFISSYLKIIKCRRTISEGASIGLVKRFSGINYDEYLKRLPKQIKYKQLVLKLTKKQPLYLLKNYEKRGVSGIDGAYHLDHKYSISEGFKNNIKPQIIADLNNLEFIPWEENVKKRTKCSITKEELITI